MNLVRSVVGSVVNRMWTWSLPPSRFTDCPRHHCRIGHNHLQSQTTANIDRFYGYLHGRRGELVLAVDLEPVNETIVEAVEAEVADMPLTELVSVVGEAESASSGRSRSFFWWRGFSLWGSGWRSGTDSFRPTRRRRSSGAPVGSTAEQRQQV